MRHRNLVSICLIYSTCRRFSTSSYYSTLFREKEVVQSIIKPENLPVEYWTKIILVAKELKEKVFENKKKTLTFLDSKHVTLLFVKPHGRFLLAFTLACDLLGARRTLYQDKNFENQPTPADSGKVLSKLTDMFVLHGFHHDVLLNLVPHVSVPVFAASSDVQCLQKAMSDMMTFYEKLNRLQGLTLAWIGPPCSLFNSYMLLCAKFGINLRYTLICSYGRGRMSPVRLFRSTKASAEDELYTKETKTVKEAVTGANIVATSLHPDESSKITSELLKNANPDHVFIHSLPRSWNEVSDEVFNRGNNLSWETSENYLYIAMAFILTSLIEYEPKSNLCSL